MRIVVTLLAVMVTAGAALAIDADTPIVDPDRRALYEQLTEEVRCLVCQNQNLADSNAPLAADLRREIRRMVEEGMDEPQIKQYLVERYGDFVLYKPQFAGQTLLLWLAPMLLLVFGGLVLWRVVARRATLPITSDEQDDRENTASWE